MTVRAKFKVQSITRRPRWDGQPGELHEVDLTVVTSGSDENKAFFVASPSGSIKIGSVNGSHSHFELGGEYYVDFTKA